MFARHMAYLNGPWKAKVLGLCATWPKLMAHAGHLWLADSQAGLSTITRSQKPSLPIVFCVVCALNAQVMIKLNNTRPMDDPFVLKVFSYMNDHALLAAYCPQHNPQPSAEDQATCQLYYQGCLQRARRTTFENAWNEPDMAMWVDYTEGFKCWDNDDTLRARAQAYTKARAKAQAKAKALPKALPKAQAKTQPKAKAKVQAKAKAKAVPKAHSQRFALARAWSQQVRGRFVPLPASPVNLAMGPNSPSSSADSLGF